MNDHTLLTVMAIFVAIAAIALLSQAIALVGLLFVARNLRTKLLESWPRIDSFVGTCRRTAEQAEQHIGKIGASSVAILEATRQQLMKLDELLSDASTRAKGQLGRAELILDDTMMRIQQTVGIVQRTVLTPFLEVHGVVRGIRMAVAHLSRSAKPPVDHVTSD